MKKTFCLVVLAMLSLSASVALADAPLRPGDALDLRIGGVPTDDQQTVSSSYTVDGEGFLNMPYIGKVRAAGLTPSGVQNAIEHAYVSEGIFTHPSITINIAPTARFVNVAGQVKAPSRVAYTPDMTVMSAINAAGDFTDFAKPSDVRLIRDGKVQRIDCKKVRGNPSLDVKVLPGDQIQVPEGFW